MGVVIAAYSVYKGGSVLNLKAHENNKAEDGIAHALVDYPLKKVAKSGAIRSVDRKRHVCHCSHAFRAYLAMKRSAPSIFGGIVT